ncbi:carboxypeptidase-like regulatory domain-containing protein [Flavobacterium sp. GT3R68]|uniref:carboxypeptidase-like regulatory domain-containing protein n=1 Tax=Flavobacterium sp. GT3R68 TaxID=2594437 RepID=UPI000F887B03|nr:carboxypeptidase-like regulatory domain-containing protein [Flavobacterium sp. GT3R68]RTY92481.1 TonB-dependent receptor [Flavobacterium sp. GSN2]TRW94107.1 TonB-dependent receptor [Flavobacterium sp. GT3R68]
MKKTVLLIIILFSTVSYSQSIKFEGVIQDNANKPLEMANVMAVNTITKAMDSYGITNDKGKFQLTLKPNSTYSIKVSYLGMQSKEVAITTKTENISQKITMEAGGIELEGVEIVREMPVSIKGDTIVYNADSFRSGTERKLEDILKKLPGVEVNADGEIEVEGKKVSKLMVEGKDFFDGDTKLGVKNIPADAIDKVQVLRNFNDVSSLKGLENGDENIAMNIKLKKGKKNFWFGDMNAGIGVADDESRYVINPKLFYYSPKYSINLIGNFNNIGELPFTMQDYFKFTGGFRSMMKKGGTNFNVSSNDLGLSILRNNRAKEIETQFGATNFSYNVNKAWSLSGFAIVSSTITDLETASQNNRIDQINNSTFTTNQITQETTHQKSNLGLFKVSSSYKPNTKLQFDYDVLLKTSRQDEDNNLLSQLTTTDANGSEINDNQNILSVKKQDPISVNQNLSLYYTKDDKNVFAVEMQHLYQDEDPFYNANLGRNPFPDSVINPMDPDNLGIEDQGPGGRYNLTQNRFVKTNKTDAKFDYYYMLTPKSNINVTLGDTYSYQGFDSDIFQILNGGIVNDMNANSINDVKYSFNDAFLGLHYKFITGKFTFNPGFSVHKYNTANEQLGTTADDDFYRVLPDVYALYQIKKAETLTYNYSVTNDFTDINKLAEGYTLTNYNSLFRGNRTLENALSQTHSLRYFKYNMFNFENIFANINYTRKVDAVKSIANFDGINQSSTPYNSNFADETLSGAASYGRSFAKNYKASVNLGLLWSKFNNIQNDKPKATESFTQSYTAKISTNYKNFPNLEIGYNLTVNDYETTTFYTEKPFAKLDYYFLNSFSFVAEYEFYHYTNNTKTVDNEYDFLSASLIYQKKDSKFEYKLSATNLLNTTSLNDDSFSQFQTRTSQYTVQPRYLILSLKYNL